MSDSADRLVLYADYVCPFCYLGTRSLERYRESREEPLEVDWRPFDLRRGKRTPDGSIDHGVDDGKDEEYFEQAKRNVRRLQEEYGVEMTQELAIEVDSLPAQQASWYVKREYPAQWAAFDDAVYEALWIDERDIGDPDVLVDIAEGVDVPSDDIRDALADDELRTELEEEFDASRRRGISGVPAFVADGRLARGAVPPARLEKLFAGAGAGDASR
ncbi:Predicted dithiol-disulfide isomerase, DsbA family [Natronorubrum sediminis]|uniref:Predicted dithiol-disulfide isomerase, DsbA family n=1 Tax=Natronorubrum sediminis TaxID=640943 RepID=A0A1H6G411_9EURY|nr:DsbA family protein [Natronorubrum sediminis]SEH17178.1 Predicted dithiol-disulfide isomerase, DsbA family [Natronorubrum sediminis]